MKLCCTSNDCGSSKSWLPKLGLIVLGALSGPINMRHRPCVAKFILFFNILVKVYKTY